MVEAVTTGRWLGLRPDLARLLACGDPEREHGELSRLDAMARETGLACASLAGRLRAETAWQMCFSMFLTSLSSQEQIRVCGELAVLVAQYLNGARPAVHVGDAGVAAGSDVNIGADRGSMAGGVVQVEGGVHIAFPSATVTGRR
ncbi:hypothetical protein ACFXAW_31320 [Streptomyces sp. NPDC059445]|uniref:hypothetical protein n=1 Tax=Streptomyces sp. NPDC059445 TaxID=3346832 RepID=UPI0036A2DC3E